MTKQIRKQIRKSEYRCQFCGEHSPVEAWKKNHDDCPKCGRAYDWMLAQDSEED